MSLDSLPWSKRINRRWVDRAAVLKGDIGFVFYYCLLWFFSWLGSLCKHVFIFQVQVWLSLLVQRQRVRVWLPRSVVRTASPSPPVARMRAKVRHSRNANTAFTPSEFFPHRIFSLDLVILVDGLSRLDPFVRFKSRELWLALPLELLLQSFIS